jgi:hypothetical protein
MANNVEMLSEHEQDLARRKDRIGLSKQIRSATGSAESPGGKVRISVDNRGRVSSAWLDPRVCAISAEVLSTAIEKACGAAFDDRIAQMINLVENSKAVDPALVQEIKAMAARRASSE